MSKGTKSIAFYLMMILIFGSLMYFIAKEGESQQLENSIASIQFRRGIYHIYSIIST